MKTSEVLELAKKHLADESHTTGSMRYTYFICNAIDIAERAYFLQDLHVKAAKNLIQLKVRELDMNCDTLCDAMLANRQIPEGTQTYSTIYLRARDKWLNELIAELKAKGE